MPPKSTTTTVRVPSSPAKKPGRVLERNGTRVGSDWPEPTLEEDAAHAAMMGDQHQQRQDSESEESVHRQRHEALEAVARKMIQIELLKVTDRMAYYKQTKPCTTDDVAANRCTVKLMACNRAMKPFSVTVPLPASDSEMGRLTLADLKLRVFEACKANFVDPVMLPLVQPHMQVLYNSANKQVGRVDDVAAMERWIAAHPPPTKKLTAAEKAALPVPPPMPSVESPDARVTDFGVEPGATIYLGIRVAAPSIIGSDPNADAEDRPRIPITPPVNPTEKVQLNKKPSSVPEIATSGKPTSSPGVTIVAPSSQQRARR